MKRCTFIFAAALAALPARAMRYERGLLWRVTKDGKTSYIYGTIHDSDARVAVPPAPY
ncbi:MAG: hypothetical protein JO292_11080 [Betaproteobacteria bacterium]|nr:hypothetical protein [Betaproteobacteria bacterium]MBV9361923.1 hypothetical protein [Betaproteobacteria bacterium]